MTAWLSVLLPAAAVGLISGVVARKWWTGAASAVVLPWLGVQTWVLYNEFCVPYQGGGASMWPIALFLAGSAAVVTGAVSFVTARICRIVVLALRE